MKIASVSENGTTLSQHFGRAPLFIVATAEKGKITAKETRVRATSNLCSCHHDSESGHNDSESGCHDSSHGQDTESQAKHSSMADSLAGCQVLISGGMGYGAYQSLTERGIETFVTDVENIDEAVKLYLEGKLVNLME
jgi:predicted Fe-Mo cluster-binding NifX family protein